MTLFIPSFYEGPSTVDSLHQSYQDLFVWLVKAVLIKTVYSHITS